eukprot:CAMPEP_0204544910 /NCGR_PEP_ID=MMETSP0661-20131031/20886_1 /ASSEMBLY_ACC=CAM_ASM_000606 /TAXON_ID=109239 /ORGANISM="Alexandrium margalefi, Strain AMGDE01CS-322" /LENGTH=89 /DNA_ID=CAMNT_0051551693 /DNA_START=11 /DNA_END=277 /DNA_ORIENTATION=-
MLRESWAWISVGTARSTVAMGAAAAAGAMARLLFHSSGAGERKSTCFAWLAAALSLLSASHTAKGRCRRESTMAADVDLYSRCLSDTQK